MQRHLCNTSFHAGSIGRGRIFNNVRSRRAFAGASGLDTRVCCELIVQVSFPRKRESRFSFQCSATDAEWANPDSRRSKKRNDSSHRKRDAVIPAHLSPLPLGEIGRRPGEGN